MRYQTQARQLTAWLEADQQTWKTFWAEYYHRQGSAEFEAAIETIREAQHKRAQAMVTILNEVGLPYISSIGAEAAQALSVLALHDTRSVLSKVLDAFLECHRIDSSDTYIEAIPSMTDRLSLLNRQPQYYATQWELDAGLQPFLPTVADFAYVNERRAAYNVGPLRWPRSLAVPEAKQPWLQRPISELVMRDITDEEFAAKYQMYVD